MRARGLLFGGLALAAVAAGCVAAAGGDRIGRLLLDLGLPAAAATVIDDPAWRGVALYRAGRPAEAARALRATRSPEAAYNLGNALARAGALDDALVAYDIALMRDPDDGDARANRALVAAAIAVRDAPAPTKGSGSADAIAATERRGGDNDVDDETQAPSHFGDGMAGQREAGTQGLTMGTSRVDRRGDAREAETEGGEASSKGAATDTAGRAGRSGGMTEAADADASAAPPAQAAAAESAQATAQWLATIPDDPARFVRLRIVAEHRRRLDAGTAQPPDRTPW